MTAPLSPSDLAEIEAVAKAATPGPWGLGWEDDCGWVAFVSELGAREGIERHVVSSQHADGDNADADAAHIARMDPATTLALLADHQRDRDALARVRVLHTAAEIPEGPHCNACYEEWPCPTLAALDADAAAGGAG